MKLFPVLLLALLCVCIIASRLWAAQGRIPANQSTPKITRAALSAAVAALWRAGYRCVHVYWDVPYRRPRPTYVMVQRPAPGSRVRFGSVAYISLMASPTWRHRQPQNQLRCNKSFPCHYWVRKCGR